MRRLLLVVLALGAGPAAAATFRSGDRIVVPRGEVLEDDLYAAGQTISIEGEVRGDVVAFGNEVVVTGHVLGDLISAAQEVRVEGAVDGSIRGAAGQLALDGAIGKDAIVVGETLVLARQASVHGDVAAAGGTVRLLGPVGRDVRVAARRLELDGRVGGAVRAQVEEASVGAGAEIKGPLDYSSTRQMPIADGARVGSVQWKPVERRQAGPAWFVFGWIRLSIGLFALGAIARLVAPKLAREAPATLRAQPWLSLGTGAAALFAAPLAGALLFGLGLLLGGWWLAVLLFAVMLVGVSLAFPTVGMLVGQALVSRFAGARGGLALALGVGVVLLAFAIRVPFLGALAGLCAMAFGLGALLLAGWHLRQAPAAA